MILQAHYHLDTTPLLVLATIVDERTLVVVGLSLLCVIYGLQRLYVEPALRRNDRFVEGIASHRIHRDWIMCSSLGGKHRAMAILMWTLYILMFIDIACLALVVIL